jgi:hypothetical protein
MAILTMARSRYYTGNATWPYGFGLSYSRFDMACTQSAAAADGAPAVTTAGSTGVEVECEVRNVGGDRDGDEVVLVFHAVGEVVRAAASRLHPVPLRVIMIMIGTLDCLRFAYDLR